MKPRLNLMNLSLDTTASIGVMKIHLIKESHNILRN